ncbi:hypothetical protein Q8F55_006533 [Vanrija albida]|uniref:LSM domain-containing protein n=1 Tax=Vanrija albida TaxID=181172 RepID=A0ABR3PXE5_9TREE
MSAAAPSPPADPRAALHALLHARLRVTLTDGRVLSGQLLAVDRGASLLLSSVVEHRALPDTAAGANVAAYYPYSRRGGEEPGAAGGAGSGGLRRSRELASVLVPFRWVVSVEVDEGDAQVWAHFAGVHFSDGSAVPPPPVPAATAA